MGDVFRKVKSGDPLRIPAETFNAFVDAAQDFRNRQNAQGVETKGSAQGNTVVLVKNASGSDQERFAVLGVAAPVISPSANLPEFKNRVVLSCVTPSDDHRGRFVVLAEPIKSGNMGRAVAAGVTPVKVSVQNSADDSADVFSGQTGHLKSGEGAASILWKESGTGIVWAVVRIGGGSGGGVEPMPPVWG